MLLVNCIETGLSLLIELTVDEVEFACMELQLSQLSEELRQMRQNQQRATIVFRKTPN